MSIGDITLNSKVFAYRNAAGREVTRGVTAATLPPGVPDSELIIAHTPGKGTKADRHVVKINRDAIAPDGSKKTVSLYVVAVVPKGLGIDQPSQMLAGEGSMSDDLATLLITDTYDFINRIIHNEFE